MSIFPLSRPRKQRKKKVHPGLFQAGDLHTTDSTTPSEFCSCVLLQAFEHTDISKAKGSSQIFGKQEDALLTINKEALKERIQPVNLLQDKSFLPEDPILLTEVKETSCETEVLRCTLTRVPDTEELLKKIKIPLGFIFFPFQNSTSTLVTDQTLPQCLACHTYINPWVTFADHHSWKCSSCMKLNMSAPELLHSFCGSIQDSSTLTGMKHVAVDFPAPPDSVDKTPQTIKYLFVFDVSQNAIRTGYLKIICPILLQTLNILSENSQTQIGFITFDSTVHFYDLESSHFRPLNLAKTDSKACGEEKLLVNLPEYKAIVGHFLEELPIFFEDTTDTLCALGPALQAAQKLLSPTGGRLSVFLSQRPNTGCGALHMPGRSCCKTAASGLQRPCVTSDFYKDLALECCLQQITVDLFLLSRQFSNLNSLYFLSRFTNGSLYYYPAFHSVRSQELCEKIQKEFYLYLSRSVGAEAVLRVSCTKGLFIENCLGNCVQQSPGVFCLPTVTPDTQFSLQMSISKCLLTSSTLVFQSCLFYTSCKGERRVRVLTWCLPTAKTPSEVYAGADVEAIVGILCYTAVDLSVKHSMANAKENLVNTVTGILSAYRLATSNQHANSLLIPRGLQHLPLYTLSLLKQLFYHTEPDQSCDERMFIMYSLKTLPLSSALKVLKPDLYRIDPFLNEDFVSPAENQLPFVRLHLSATSFCEQGVFFMNCGSVFYIWVGRLSKISFLKNTSGASNVASYPLSKHSEVNSVASKVLFKFVESLRTGKSVFPVCYIIRSDHSSCSAFDHHLVEDRSESSLSYVEWLQLLYQKVYK
ncbi:protein transport protein Sec24A-like isoform X1 [Erpetoichthys calabaricus]|uniref:protein transport protein Sec24A-like isoform X1 n=1 Tax=Erpetoichthys calabaricus TaxID=27687 RepID=UPI0010A02373|nr:protein transport protein Sec24A-like isoform X1 [Erpetoichthys calabaricus]